MNNLSIKLKKMLSNKNVVTALCFLLIAVVLIIGYNYQINKKTEPVTVAYAVVTIPPETIITEEMIETKQVPRTAVDSDTMIIKKEDLIGKYVTLESTVYKGSFFYKDAIVKAEDMPTSALLGISPEETLLTLNVDMQSSYYNSLVPGNYFDLYVRTIGVIDTKEKNNEIIVGKLLSAIKILAVKTESGENAFGSDVPKVPSGVLFAVPNDYALLIMKADYFSKLSRDLAIEFVIIPRGLAYEDENGEEVTTTISSEKLEKYIKDKTAEIDIKDIKNNTEIGE